jgi:KaiC/GvpD/RAD55 family RecA-like ATPase
MCFNISSRFDGMLKENKIFKKNFNFEKEKKYRAIEKILLKKKKLETREELKKNIELNKKPIEDENLIYRYLERVKKVDDLIKKMEKRKENADFSLRTILKRDDGPKKGIISPEFLETPPFKIDGISNQRYYENFSPIKNFNSRFFGNNKVSKTELIENENFVTDSLDESFSEDEIKEKFDYPLITEIEILDKKKTSTKSKTETERKWMFTGITGFDELLEKGIPTGSNIIVAGGPGSGKTIFCSQVIYNKALEGRDCIFLSMEERPDRLKDHMVEFGFKVKEIERSAEQIILSADGKGRIALKRLQPIRLARSIEALLEKASGTLPVDIDLVLDFIPKDFDACLLVLDSISAIETAFSGTKRQYRIYIEQLFRYFEKMNVTTFMITESSDAPHRFSNTGVEEFLADGIFVFYNFQGVKKRTRGAEIYKLRGASHSQKIVTMIITGNGIEISPDLSCKEQVKG